MNEPREEQDADHLARQLELFHDKLLAGGSRNRSDDLSELAHNAELASAAEVLDLLERVRGETPFGEPSAATRASFSTHGVVPSVSQRDGMECDEVESCDDASLTAGVDKAAIPRTIGRFEIKRTLGRGGHGLVFLAFDPQLNRDVALKVPRLETLLTNDLQARFLLEGRAAAGLNHPNIVAVYDAGKAGPIYYIATRFVAGPSLSSWLASHDPPVGPQAAARLISTLADAMEHAHGRGVVHRDLKPSNVMLDLPGTDSPAVREDQLAEVAAIADFGLAKVANDRTTETRTGAIVGTPAYMAPEQIGGKALVGPGTDVYGLGAMLYELLTGEPPFRRDSVIETVRAIQETEPISPRNHRPEVPRDLESICLKCLEKAVTERYLSARDLQADLERFLCGQPVLARSVTALTRAGKFVRRNKMLVSLATIFVVGLLAALVVSALFGFNEHRQRTRANVLLSETDRLVDEIKRLSLDVVSERAGGFAGMEGSTSARYSLLIGNSESLAVLAEKTTDDATTQLQIAQAFIQLGGVQGGHAQQNIGDYKGADASFAKALAIVEPLYQADSDNMEVQQTLAQLYLHLGYRSLSRQEVDTAMERAELALKLLETHPESENAFYSLKQRDNALGLLGAAKGMRGDHAGASEAFESAVDVARKVADRAGPNDKRQRHDLANRLAQRATAKMRVGNFEGADADFAESIRGFSRLVESAPLRADYRYSIAQACYTWAHLYMESNDFERLHEVIDSGLEQAERLMENDSANTNARRIAGELYYMRGEGKLKAADELGQRDDTQANQERAPLLQESMVAYRLSRNTFQQLRDEGKLRRSELGYLDRIDAQIAEVEQQIENLPGNTQ